MGCQSGFQVEDKNAVAVEQRCLKDLGGQRPTLTMFEHSWVHLTTGRNHWQQQLHPNYPTPSHCKFTRNTVCT